MFLSSEALSEGSNWNWECVTWLKLADELLHNFAQLCTCLDVKPRWCDVWMKPTQWRLRRERCSHMSGLACNYQYFVYTPWPLGIYIKRILAFRFHLQADNTVKELWLTIMLYHILLFNLTLFLCHWTYLTLNMMNIKTLSFHQWDLTKEIRNGNCGRMMCVLTQSRTFSSSSHAHLVVGHTHEDVDAVLSLVKRALDSETVLLTPRDMMRAIEKRLCPLYEQQGMQFKTFWVDQAAWHGLQTSFSHNP